MTKQDDVQYEPTMDNDALVAAILPWAKEHRPDAYAKTLAVANRPATFRRYLLRCVELRCAEDKAWRDTLPVSVLDETALAITVTHRPTGRKVRIGGRLAEPRPTLPFSSLTMPREEFVVLLEAAELFDAEAL